METGTLALPNDYYFSPHDSISRNGGNGDGDGDGEVWRTIEYQEEIEYLMQSAGYPL